MFLKENIDACVKSKQFVLFVVFLTTATHNTHCVSFDPT